MFFATADLELLRSGGMPSGRKIVSGLGVLSLLCLGGGCRRDAAPLATGGVAAPHQVAVDFNRDIRPLFNQHCVACHGGVKMSGKISFVFREEATRAGETGRITIKPGDPDHSELIARLTTRDPEKRMPPVDHGPALAEAQVALFRRWISEGAKWSEHWAFVGPKPQTVPALAPGSRAGPIDAFVLDRLAKERLQPSSEADRATLLRRLSLDLTGLPPTPAEMAAFLADSSPEAYLHQVDRLLESPQYGERWATLWLDLSRYADSRGYEKDLGRSVWPYRDWLIDALNQNMPYDRFVVEQVAGDLLPNPTFEQKIATGFHRQTQANDEGGTDDEEFRMLAVQDRAVTTWAVFNGVSFNCVQCHSHPYDPIRHQEYYRFLAFFNNTADADYFNNDFPTLHVPNRRADFVVARELEEQIRRLRQERVDAGQKLQGESGMWTSLKALSASAEPRATFELRDGEVYATGPAPSATVRYEIQAELPAGEVTAFRLEVPPLDPVKARHSPEPGFIVGEIEAAIVHADGREENVPWDSFWPDSPTWPVARQGIIRRMGTKSGVAPASAGPGTDAPAPKAPAKEPTFSDLPPGGFASIPSLYRTRWLVGVPAQTVAAESGARLRLRLQHSRGVDDFDKPTPVRRLRLAASSDTRWTRLAAATKSESHWVQMNQLEARLLAIPGTEVPVMEDLPSGEEREMRVFSRGNWLEKIGEPLMADVPALFPPLPAGAPRNRLTLARWLVAPGHPLTARVAVNRYWEQLFGTGLVETLEDFGSAGAAPSHPELLDWLALHFQNDLHWDVKALLRELVMTATYRQSARITPELLAKDPRNRLLARGPHNRLAAEMVRDQALVASGLLNPERHGPPVMPPQPDGVWATVYNSGNWIDATGPDRYRRALYTFWKRTSPYPSFVSFDTPARDVCALRRIPTNTPLQALVTLNDPVYHEAAQELARRMKREAPELPGQIAAGFRRVTSRDPRPEELKPLMKLHAQALERRLEETESSTKPDQIPPDVDALSAVAEALLNLDAALTK
ncbi:MAG: hypothetical protein JWM88_2298 [Verrucomicrobia bacterium]|nr:hypothetical protein [Verrucomicrobiota bacterium]